MTLTFFRPKRFCHVKHYTYGVAQRHYEWDILSISNMAHTLLPNYKTTNIQVRLTHFSVKKTELVFTITLKASSKNKFDRDL